MTATVADAARNTRNITEKRKRRQKRMSESTAKACRRMIDREMAKKSRWMINTFVKNVKSYPFKYRFKFAMQILRGEKKKK